MDNVVEYNRRGAISNALVGSGSGGGGVDEILKRLGNVETHVSELRTQVSSILAVIPYLATKADLKGDTAEIKAAIGDVKAEAKADIAEVKAAAKADIAEVKTAIADVKTQMASQQTAMIKWIIATVLTAAGLAFTIAKFVH